MATSKKNTKSVKKGAVELTKGAATLVILFCTVIGLLLGYLVAYLVL